jgi:hypothetical protein
MDDKHELVLRRLRWLAAAIAAVVGVVLFDRAPAAATVLAPAVVIGLLARNRLPTQDAVFAAAIASLPGAVAYAVLRLLDPNSQSDIGFGLLFGFVCLLSALAAIAFVMLRRSPDHP